MKKLLLFSIALVFIGCCGKCCGCGCGCDGYCIYGKKDIKHIKKG